LLDFFRRHYATHTRGVVAAAFVTAVAALTEATALIMIVPLAERATLGGDRATSRIGPIEVELGTSQLLGIVLVLILFSGVAKVLALWLRARTVRSWELRQRTRALALLLNADYEYTSRLSPAELQAMVGSHVGQAAQGLAIIGQVTNAGISFGILLFAAFSTAPLAALIIAVVGGGLLAGLRPLSGRLRAAGRESSEQGLMTARLVNEAARDGREIRLHGAQDHVLDAYRRAAGEHAATQRRTMMIGGLAPILYQSFGLMLVVAALGLALTYSDLDVTALGAVALLFLRSLGYGQQLSNTQGQYNQMVPFVDRLDAELDQLHAARERFGDDPLDRVERIELRTVGYVYPGVEEAEPALDGIDLELTRPGLVGLVGPSGSGKSTFAQVLLRLRHPTSGEVLVNGRDIGVFSRSTWAEQVALVPQYPQLIRASVRDNIAFFRPSVADDDIRRAAASVGLHELFESLPDGYDTVLGESGRELSGGQLQRIGIARALVGRPSLVILDEPTSALDTETEAWVQRSILELGEDALVVVITHRHSTLEVCSRVIHLAGGRVVLDELVPSAARGSA
jgi:ATP-binding cassette, subfamily B, bacterial